ncbi:MAG: carboxymuconolactone decarboxylase family protein [Actinomycetota bacterium]|nr:carboxymuconolactone decarboxylase family protein [Actinomycetota bacterium]
MRLGILDRGHRPRQRAALRVLRLVGRTEPDPVAKVSLYRPELFGRAWMHFIEAVMRGDSEWSHGERELLGAFVSRLNSCPFCIGIHEGTTALLLGPQSGAERLDRWRENGFDPRIAATFELLEKMTLSPQALSSADIVPVRAAGVTDTAITDALYICFLFNVVNRLANALDFQWKTDADRMKLAAGLNRIGYHVPEFLLH